MHVRIRRYDSSNWVIERFHQGGVTQKGLGTVSKDRWHIEGYYNTLERAASGCLEALIEPGVTGEHLLTRLSDAQRAILAALERASGDDRQKLGHGAIHVDTGN